MKHRGHRVGLLAFGASLVLSLGLSLVGMALWGHRGITQVSITGPEGRQLIRMVVYNPSWTAVQLKEIQVEVRSEYPNCGDQVLQVEFDGEVMFSIGPLDHTGYPRPSWLFANGTTVTARGVKELTCGMPSTTLFLSPNAELPARASREICVLLVSDFSVLRCNVIEPATDKTSACVQKESVAVSFVSLPLIEADDDQTVTASVRVSTSNAREFMFQAITDKRDLPRR